VLGLVPQPHEALVIMHRYYFVIILKISSNYNKPIFLKLFNYIDSNFIFWI